MIADASPRSAARIHSWSVALSSNASWRVIMTYRAVAGASLPSTLAVHPIAPRDLRRGGWIQREIARHYVTGEACSTGARLMRETREPAKASSISSRINSSIVEGVGRNLHKAETYEEAKEAGRGRSDDIAMCVAKSANDPYWTFALATVGPSPRRPKWQAAPHPNLWADVGNTTVKRRSLVLGCSTYWDRFWGTVLGDRCHDTPS